MYLGLTRATGQPGINGTNGEFGPQGTPRPLGNNGTDGEVEPKVHESSRMSFENADVYMKMHEVFSRIKK